MKMKVFFTTIILLLVAIACSIAQSVVVQPDSSVVVNLPQRLIFPDFSKAGWALTNEFFGIISALVTVALGFVLQLVPKWRNMNIAMVSKISIIAVVSVAIVFSIGGKDAWQAIIALIMNSVLFQAHWLYTAVAKPVLGSSSEVGNVDEKKAKMGSERL